jgi:drug/metabolite transporter (DMT)-like permease
MKRTPYIFVIAAAVLWGMIGIFSKQLYEFGFGVFQIVSIRAIFSSVIVLLFLLFKDKSLLRIELRDSRYFLGTGIISFTFFNWCYFMAINKTSLAVAAILLYTAPAFVMMFSALLFKEKLTKRKLSALAFTFAGCFLVAAFVEDASGSISAVGITAGLGAGLGYALYSIFGRYALDKYDPFTVTFYTFVFASLGLIPISDIKGMMGLLSNAEALFCAIALSVLSTVLPFLLYTKGLSQLESGRASIIATLEPIVAAIMGIILLGEPVTIYKTAGTLVVVFAVSMLVDKDKGILEKE